MSWSNSLTAIDHLFQTKNWNTWPVVRTSERCYLVARILRIFVIYKVEVQSEAETNFREVRLEPVRPASLALAPLPCPLSLPSARLKLLEPGCEGFSASSVELGHGAVARARLSPATSCGWAGQQGDGMAQARGMCCPTGHFPSLGLNTAQRGRTLCAWMAVCQS